MKKILILMSLLVGAISATVMFSATALAENDDSCPGRVEGVISQLNPNVGDLTFDAHYYWGGESDDPSYVYGIATSLAVVGISEQGLAPGDGLLAACITKDSTAVQGYAWMTNAGFLSFSCDGGGGLCGSQAYGVYIGEDESGKRYLTGDAWNEVFGYLKFDNGVADGDVYVDSDGILHGYAWTDAKVWIDFNGVKFVFPGEVSMVPVGEENVCYKRPYVCVDVTIPLEPGDPTKPKIPKDPTNPATPEDAKLLEDNPYNPNNVEAYDVQAMLGVFGDMAVADGADGYAINLYLREKDGVTPMKLSDYKFKNIKFNWQDTVKINQTQGQKAPGNLGNLEFPWKEKRGAVVYKPINVSFPDDFLKVEDGHWVLKKVIQSYAPTTKGNVSMTTGFMPNTQYKNEFFFTDLGDPESPWTVPGNIEPNKLVLNSIGFSLKTKTGEDVIYKGQNLANGVTFADGKVEREFNFRPAAYLAQLYSDDLKDSIGAFRGIPFVLKIKAKMVGELEKKLKNEAEIAMFLDYDKGMTAETCGSGSDFDLFFQKDESGSAVFDVTGLTSLTELIAIAELAKKNKDGADGGCKVVGGPTVYSIVKYVVDNVEVSYYSNKLPRIATVIGNPDVVVHGNIYAPQAFTPTHKTQSGNVGSKAIRDAAYENLAKSLRGIVPQGGGKCTIKKLEDSDTVSCDGNVKVYEKLKIGDENVLYFKNTDVIFALSAWENEWVVVVEGGRIYIDEDIYGGALSDDRKMSILGLRPYGEECAENNVYIQAEVTNLQMNLLSDCTVFSYVKAADIDKTTGEPKWVSFSDRVGALGKQLLVQGSVMSRNTVGGSDGEDFAVDGYGNVYKYPLNDVDRLHVQGHDWNYMRIGKGQLEYAANGLAIDQSCGKALNVEDMVKIKQGGSVTGEKMDSGMLIACDGIDPTNIYDPVNKTGGDLVPKTEGLAKGLDPVKEQNPVYIYYVAPSSDSFVFKKAGGTSN